MGTDAGYFGPTSVSWQVHRETTVLLGGARALLLQAAHPLVIAGAQRTGFYERDPWGRLERTLRLTYAITFGTRREAEEAAERINTVHERVNGIDPMTGKPYDALDPSLLLYVHACLVDSALLFERLTVGRLDDAGRQRFHEEQMLVAELLRVPRDVIPATVGGLQAFLEEVVARDLVVGDAARAVAALFKDPPREATWRPVLRVVGRWAFGTLPPALRRAYGETWTPAHQVAFRATMAAIRRARPLLPRRVRFIQPAEIARTRAAAVPGPPGARAG